MGSFQYILEPAGERDLYRWERLTEMTWHFLKDDVAKFMATEFFINWDKKRISLVVIFLHWY